MYTLPKRTILKKKLCKGDTEFANVTSRAITFLRYEYFVVHLRWGDFGTCESLWYESLRSSAFLPISPEILAPVITLMKPVMYMTLHDFLLIHTISAFNHICYRHLNKPINNWAFIANLNSNSGIFFLIDNNHHPNLCWQYLLDFTAQLHYHQHHQIILWMYSSTQQKR